MTSPSKNAFKCPKWLQCTCCLMPLAFLGCLTIGAAFGVQISPYVAIPVVALNARVVAAALGLAPTSIVALGRPHAVSPQSRSDSHTSCNQRSGAASSRT